MLTFFPDADYHEYLSLMPNHLYPGMHINLIFFEYSLNQPANAYKGTTNQPESPAD